jgi:tetratricopeptide (TPR) repeat protein
LLTKQKGDLAGAVKLMQHSLLGNDRQPHVHYNLATLFNQNGQPGEALQHYRRAVQLAPNYVDALVQLGESLIMLENFAEAAMVLRKAFALQPNSIPVIVALADLCGKTGDPAAAQSLLREGLRQWPDDVILRNNLGLSLSEQLRYDEALELLMPLARLAPSQPSIFVNIGNALLGAGRMDEAVRHFDQAISLDPRNYFAHANVNSTLWQLGRKQDIGKSYRYAKQVLPQDPDILEMAAESAIAFGRLDDAEADLLDAERIRPNSMYQYRLWTALRLAQKHAPAAIAVAEAGLRVLPDDPDLLRKLAEACLMADRPQDALAAAQNLAKLDPFNQLAAAYMATAHRLLGNQDAARRIYDYERFIHAVDLPPPAGYEDLADYHRCLTLALDKLHHAHHEPIYQSLRKGTQTHENLFDRPGIDPAIGQLGDAVLAAAARFAGSLPDDPQHPFLGRKSDKLDWSGSWSVRLRDGGHHIDHVHHKGWISGSYYVTLPDCLADQENKPGWIKFGEFRQQTGPSLPWEKAVRPHAGLMVLFPSYMWHGTLPITGDQQRLTVAFDIIPAKR